MLAPNVPRDAKKPGLKWAALVKPVQRLPKSHKGVVREVRRVVSAVEQPEKPPIQAVVVFGHKFFAPVPLVPELQWPTGFNVFHHHWLCFHSQYYRSPQFR